MEDNNYTTLGVNGVELAVKTANLRKLEKYADAGARVEVNVPFTVEFRHIGVISKILAGNIIVPMVDLASHLDVLIVIKLAREMGVPDDDLLKSFNGWSEHRKWIELKFPEYMYLIFTEIEELVDFRKFFRIGLNVFDTITRAVKLPETRVDPTYYITMLEFFKNYKFELCFDHNNDKVQARIESLTKERNAAGEIFLINPHEPFMADFFKHVETNYDTWDCKGISVIAKPEVGQVTIASLDEVKARMHSFTYGLLDKPLNPNVQKPFPFANVAFAGGAAAKLLASGYDKKNARQSDVDIFIFGKTFDERSRVFEEVLEWFKTYNKVSKSQTFYALRGSVTTIYIKGVQRKFQIISINSSSIYEVIARFDLTHIQWCMWNGQMYGTPEACRSIRERVTKFANTQRLRTNRLIKALHCGYSIVKDPEIVEKHCDIGPLIGDPNNIQLTNMIRDLYGFYYPIDDPEMDVDEEKQHILCMVAKDANATFVTDDPAFVLNNVTIGGNFENDYESLLYSTFNQDQIVNRVNPRRINKLILRQKHGAIRLTSGIMKVTNIITNDNGIEIVTKNEEDGFREFCNLLEGPVYRLFRNGGVSRHIMNEQSEVRFTVPKYMLDNQTTRGVSCLRSQRGAALNIEEDLKPGDDLQVLFLLEVIMFPEERAINLKPVKFVKYQKYNPEDAAKIQAVEENLEKEIDRIITETEFASTINYVELDVEPKEVR